MTDIAHDVAATTRDRLSELAPLLDALAAVAMRGEVPGPELLARAAAAQAALSDLAQEPKDVSLISVGARFGDYVDNAARRAAKFRCI